MIEDMAVKIKDMLSHTNTYSRRHIQHIQKGELLVYICLLKSL